MSQVIRFKDLVQMLEIIDCIKIGDKHLFIEDIEQLEITNPLVHIDLIEKDYEEGEGSYGHATFIAYTYYITIL